LSTRECGERGERDRYGMGQIPSGWSKRSRKTKMVAGEGRGKNRKEGDGRKCKGGEKRVSVWGRRQSLFRETKTGCANTEKRGVK